MGTNSSYQKNKDLHENPSLSPEEILESYSTNPQEIAKDSSDLVKKIENGSPNWAQDWYQEWGKDWGKDMWRNAL